MTDGILSIPDVSCHSLCFACFCFDDTMIHSLLSSIFQVRVKGRRMGVNPLGQEVTRFQRDLTKDPLLIRNTVRLVKSPNETRGTRLGMIWRTTNRRPIPRQMPTHPA